MALLIVIILLNGLNVGQTDDWYCPYILKTMKIVSSCPSTNEENISAAERLNCAKHSVKQNCTKPQNFVYHCVIDAEEKSLYEVCARARFISEQRGEINNTEQCQLRNLLESFEKAKSFNKLYWLPARESILNDLNKISNYFKNILLDESEELSLTGIGMRRAYSLASFPLLLADRRGEPREIDVRRCRQMLINLKNICESVFPKMKANVLHSNNLADLLQGFQNCPLQSFSNEVQIQEYIKSTLRIDTITEEVSVAVRIVKLRPKVESILSTTLGNLTLTVDVAVTEMEAAINFLKSTIVQESLNVEDVHEHSRTLNETITRLKSELSECRRIFDDRNGMEE